MDCGFRSGLMGFAFGFSFVLSLAFAAHVKRALKKLPEPCISDAAA